MNDDDRLNKPIWVTHLEKTDLDDAISQARFIAISLCEDAVIVVDANNTVVWDTNIF